MSTYAYLNFVAPLNITSSPASNTILTMHDQQERIIKKFSAGIAFVFTENSDCQTSAFKLMLQTLKSSDVVVMWDWRCLVAPNNLAKASADLWASILKIHEIGASVRLINGDHETKTAKGRWHLTLNVAGAQYEHDRQVEDESTACCEKNASTGC